MVRKVSYRSLIPLYCIVLAAFILLAVGGGRAVTVMSSLAPVINRKTVIIDAGHGGIDGGATSVSGVLESKLNLDIALKLRDIMGLLGINTVMIRETDCSVYTQGQTIGQKKISDLKERVRIVNSTENAILVSIHQNHFSAPQYSGAQVFYAPTEESREVAGVIQEAIVRCINPGSRRQIKKADGVYLMQNISCPGILVECGFISNYREEYLLRDAVYQRKMCSIIACTMSCWLFNT